MFLFFLLIVKYELVYFYLDVIFFMDFLRYVGVNNYMLEKNFVKLMVCFLNFVNNRSCVVFYSFSDCF